jgi:hypothetical protein
LPYVSEDRFKPLRNHVLRHLGTKKRFMELANVYAKELERDADRYRTHAISAEQLLVAEEEAVAGLKGFCPLGAETKIVVYIRHPAEGLSSLISQQLRGGDAILLILILAG